MPMLIVYTQIYIIKRGLLSIIDFKGMGMPYTLGSSGSSMLFMILSLHPIYSP